MAPLQDEDLPFFILKSSFLITYGVQTFYTLSIGTYHAAQPLYSFRGV